MIQIKNILESLHDDVVSSRMTLTEAAAELCKSGWMNYIDEERTRRLLNLVD